MASIITRQCNNVSWNTDTDQAQVQAAGLAVSTLSSSASLAEAAWKNLIEGNVAVVPVGDSDDYVAALTAARSSLDTLWGQVNTARNFLESQAGSAWELVFVCTPVAWALKPASVVVADSDGVIQTKGADGGVSILVVKT